MSPAAGRSAGASPAASPAIKRFKYRQYEDRQFWVACADLKQQERLYKARQRHHEPSQREACEAAGFPRTTFITWWIKLQCAARSEEECITYAAGQPWAPPQQQSPVAQAVAALEAEARMEEASPARVAMQAHGARQAPMSPTRPGHPTLLLPEEEEAVVVSLEYHNDHGLSVSRQQVAGLIFNIVRAREREVPTAWLLAGRPSNKWYKGFEKRWRHRIRLRKSDPLEHSRLTLYKEQVDSFYTVLQREEAELAAEGISITADMCWNLDETCFMPDGSATKVYARRGSHQSYTLGKTNRESVTILIAICADGSHAPPLVITKGTDNKPPHWWADCAADLAGTAFEHATCVQQANAYMNNVIFLRWFQQKFLPYTAVLRADKFVILVLDNFAAHVHVDVLDLAAANRVHVIGLPPHSTHVLQPLDRTCMHSLKLNYTNNLQSWRMIPGNELRTVRPKDIMHILTHVCAGGAVAELRKEKNVKVESPWSVGLSPKNITQGFKVTGIWPLDPTATAVYRAPLPSLEAVKAVAAQLLQRSRQPVTLLERRKAAYDITAAAHSEAAAKEVALREQLAAQRAAVTSAHGAMAAAAAAWSEQLVQGPAHRLEFALSQTVLNKQAAGASLLTASEHRAVKRAELQTKERLQAEKDARKAARAAAKAAKAAAAAAAGPTQPPAVPGSGRGRGRRGRGPGRGRGRSRTAAGDDSEPEQLLGGAAGEEQESDDGATVPDQQRQCPQRARRAPVWMQHGAAAGGGAAGSDAGGDDGSDYKASGEGSSSSSGDEEDEEDFFTEESDMDA
eukprot:XP_001698444.1 predicted protein [Chlamydomonas reinhardtii]